MYGIRTSVCPSVRPSVPFARGTPLLGFAAVGPASRRYRSIAARRSAAAAPQHGALQQMRAAPRCQLTQEAEHRLVRFEMLGE